MPHHKHQRQESKGGTYIDGCCDRKPACHLLNTRKTAVSLSRVNPWNRSPVRSDVGPQRCRLNLQGRRVDKAPTHMTWMTQLVANPKSCFTSSGCYIGAGAPRVQTEGGRVQDDAHTRLFAFASHPLHSLLNRRACARSSLPDQAQIRQPRDLDDLNDDTKSHVKRLRRNCHPQCVAQKSRSFARAVH